MTKAHALGLFLLSGVIAHGGAAADASPSAAPEAPKIRADDPQAESLNRGDAYAHLIAAGLAVSRGRAGEAVHEVEAAVALEPASAGLHAQGAALLAMLGRRADADRLARRALELDPSQLEAVRVLADLAAARSFGPKADAQSRAEAIRLFEAQVASRHLDLAARWLRSFGEGFYTIGSAGHEGNAAVAAALRPTDPALLHYRSGAFYLARAQQTGRDKEGEAVRDVARGLVASALEPIAGGRHKVFGHADLAIVPTTSTIASHLPRAVGLGYAISHCAASGIAGVWPAVAERADRDGVGRSARPRRPPRWAPPAGVPTGAGTCRCCSSARTTASASACARPRTGSTPRTWHPCRTSSFAAAHPLRASPTTIARDPSNQGRDGLVIGA
jgi:hypothetical protein